MSEIDDFGQCAGEIRRLAALVGRAQVLLEHVTLDCKPTNQDWHDRVRVWLEELECRECPGCHPSGGERFRSGEYIRQRVNGDLVCIGCGRVTALAEDLGVR